MIELKRKSSVFDADLVREAKDLALNYDFDSTKKGDITVIIHGCNAQGVMGSGIAKALRDAFPVIYDHYSNVHKTEGLALGSIQVVKITPYLHIVNAITQEFYRGFMHSDGTIEPDNKRYVSYDAITDVSNALNHYYNDVNGKVSFLFPAIGCGLANGAFSIVSTIINQTISDKFTKEFWLQ